MAPALAHYGVAERRVLERPSSVHIAIDGHPTLCYTPSKVFTLRQRAAGYAAEGNTMTHSQGATEQGKGGGKRYGCCPYFSPKELLF
jgi:hypothetical protein